MEIISPGTRYSPLSVYWRPIDQQNRVINQTSQWIEAWLSETVIWEEHVASCDTDWPIQGQEPGYQREWSKRSMWPHVTLTDLYRTRSLAIREWSKRSMWSHVTLTVLYRARSLAIKESDLREACGLMWHWLTYTGPGAWGYHPNHKCHSTTHPK